MTAGKKYILHCDQSWGPWQSTRNYLSNLFLRTNIFLIVCQIWKTFLAWCSDIKVDINDDEGIYTK